MPTITISVSDKMKDFVTGIVADGTYNNASEVFREGLRTIEERQIKLQALRAHIDAAIERGGSNSEDDVLAYVDSHLDNLDDIGA